MGGSLGATQAVQALLTTLPATLALPIVLVLHRHRDSDVALVELLQRGSALKIVEVTDKQRAEPGALYLAPPDYHVLVEGAHLALSIDAAVRYARPSVDVLFESAALALGARAIGVILTGGGADGSQGAAAIEAAGGRVLVQDPAEAAAGDMPSATIAAVQQAEILGLESIGRRLVQLAS